MITADIAVIVIMAVGLVAWVGEPLVRRRRVPDAAVDARSDAIERLVLQRETLYTAIRDLDFDHQTGKVDADDHAVLRRQMEEEAAGVLRDLDLADPTADIDFAAEQHILAYRQKEDAASPVSEPTCPACGTGLAGDAASCTICGQELKTTES